jgi:hypothetical protein
LAKATTGLAASMSRGIISFLFRNPLYAHKIAC